MCLINSPTAEPPGRTQCQLQIQRKKNRKSEELDKICLSCFPLNAALVLAAKKEMISFQSIFFSFNGLKTVKLKHKVIFL